MTVAGAGGFDEVPNGVPATNSIVRDGSVLYEKAWLSLALVNEADAQIGSEVTVIWGEPDGGTRKPHVEKHRQIEIRATIASCPYAKPVQEMLRATIGKPAVSAVG